MESMLQLQQTSNILVSEKNDTIVLDIESLSQILDRSTGNPVITRALSRKLSNRADRSTIVEEEDVAKGNSQMEPIMKQQLGGPIACGPNSPKSNNVGDMMTDCRSKRFHRFMAINPRKIVFIFATLSSMGTLLLICFTLAINKRIYDNAS